MNFVLVRTIVRFRSLLVSIVTGGITWVILIIAPLGLFTVIVCTMAVFLSSLTLGLVGDFFLFRILRQARFNGVNGAGEDLPFVDSQLPSMSYSESIRRRNNY